MIQIPGFEWQPVNRGEGVSWKADYRRKIIVFHRTQGNHVRLSQSSSPVSHYLTGSPRKHCPHGTLSPKFGQAWQHTSIDIACNWTSRDNAGGVETYDAKWTVQFEVTGMTDQGPGDLTTAEWEWMGEKFAQTAKAMGGSKIVFVDDVYANCKWVNASDGFVARPDAPQRMTFSQWMNTFANDPSTVLIVGHCHIPENDHYDPGRLDKAAMFRGAARVFGTAPPNPTGEDEMATLLRSTDGTTAQQATVFAWNGSTITQFSNDPDMRSIGVTAGVLSVNGADTQYYAFRRPAAEIQALINLSWGGPRGQTATVLNGYSIPADPSVDPAIKARDNAANALFSVGPDLKTQVQEVEDKTDKILAKPGGSGGGASIDEIETVLGRSTVQIEHIPGNAPLVVNED